MTNKIQGVLFDFNGTMVFDSVEHKKAWNVFSLKYRKKPITDEEMAQMHGKTNKHIIKMILGDCINDEDSEQLSKDKEALYREICKSEKAEYHFVDGLVEVLDELKKRKVPMTICSASIQDNIEFFIEHFNLKRWFDVTKIVFDDGSHVDKVSMFHKGADLIHVPIEKCLVLEDSLSGIHFANKCNVAKIIAITTYDQVQEYERMEGISKVILDYLNFDYSDF